MDRAALLLGSATKVSRLLEIGPSHSPIAPKAAGWNTHVVDHLDQSALLARYRALGIDTTRIEAVDTIWTDGDLHDAVPDHLHGGFDRLIASHVVEHIPDLIRFLRSAERLCRPEGVVALAIPDPRFCFDYCKPRSTTGDVLEAYVARRTRHSLRGLWNEAAYAVTMDGAGAWGQHPVGELALSSPFALAEQVLREVLDDPTQAVHRDCHAWAFTPAGFTLAMLELAQLGLVDWRIDGLDGPEGCEFIVRLRRGASPMTDRPAFEARRLALMRQQLAETAEQLAFAHHLAEPPALPADIEQRLAGIEQRLGTIERILAQVTRLVRPFLPLWRRLRR